MIKTINSLLEVKNIKANLFFFDIQETLLKENLYYKMIENNFFASQFLEICISNNIQADDMLKEGRYFFRELTENHIPKTLELIKKRKSKIFALTSGYPSYKKRLALKELNISLNGILFASRMNKGIFLSNFLKKFTNLEKIQTICFVDNDLYKLEDVKKECEVLYPNIEFILLLYHNKNNINKVTFESFKKYWNNVANKIKKKVSN